MFYYKNFTVCTFLCNYIKIVKNVLGAKFGFWLRASKILESFGELFQNQIIN